MGTVSSVGTSYDILQVSQSAHDFPQKKCESEPSMMGSELDTPEEWSAAIPHPAHCSPLTAPTSRYWSKLSSQFSSEFKPHQPSLRFTVARQPESRRKKGEPGIKSHFLLFIFSTRTPLVIPNLFFCSARIIQFIHCQCIYRTSGTGTSYIGYIQYTAYTTLHYTNYTGEFSTFAPICESDLISVVLIGTSRAEQ